MKKCSVIIPTYNGAGKILHLLNALKVQTNEDFETIVVVDGSTDQTTQLLQENKSLLHDLKIISQQNKGRSGARNSGSANAQGELLIFFDDDVEPAPDCIQQHVNHHSTIKNSLMFGKLLMDCRETLNDFYRYRHFNEVKWIEPFGSALRKITFDQFAVTTQNMSMPRMVFGALNRFDERLTDSEDFDLGVRALLNNVPLYFNPSAFAWHRDFVGIDKYIHRQKEYYTAKKELLKIHPDYLNHLPKHFAFLQPVSFKKRLAAKVFRYNRVWNFLIHNPLFLMLVPRKRRFRVYEILIYSSSVLQPLNAV